MPQVIGKDYLVNSGGLNLRAASTAIPETDAEEILNLTPYQSGAWQVRNGLVKVNTTALDGEISGIFDYQIAGGGALRRIPIVATSNGTLYRMDGATPTIIKTGLHKDAVYHFANYLDLLIIANGVDRPHMYDGTTVVELAALPRASIVHIHKGRLFMDDPAFPKRIWFTRVGEFNSLPALNFTDDPYGGGQRVKALETYYDNLLIFTDDTVQVFAGEHIDFDDDLFDASRGILINNRGASGRFVVRSHDNLVYSLDDKGPYVISGRQVNPIGIKTERFWRQNVQVREFPNAFGVIDEEFLQYRLFLKKIGGLEQVTWTFNFVDQSAATEEFPKTITYVAEVENEDDRREIWIGDKDGFVYRNVVSADDDGVDITCKYRTPWYPAQPTADHARRLRYLFINVQALGNIDMTIRVYTDFRGDPAVTRTITLTTTPTWDNVNWDEFTWDGATDMQRRIDLGLTCRWVRFEFEAACKGAFRLNGWGVYWRGKPLRHLVTRNQ